MAKYRVTHEGDGFYTISDVPIFEMHEDRGFPCDESWMKEAIANFNKLKESDYKPAVILGHNVPGQEKEAVGFLDNLVLKGKRLYADLIRIPKTIKEKIVQNSYPNRSVEVLPKGKRILALALLGGTTPHFALPQMAYDTEEMSLWYRSPQMNGFTEEQKAELRTLIGEAVTSYGKKDEPVEVYELSTAEVQEALSSGSIPELYEGADGRQYSIGEDGVLYAWPNWVLKLLQTRGGNVAAKGMAKASRAGRTAVASKAGQKAIAGGKAAGRKAVAGKNWVKGHPMTAAGIGAGALGAAAGASELARRRNKGYAIDPETGVVYFNGQPVGEVVTYEEMNEQGMSNPTAPDDPAELPDTDDDEYVPSIDESAVGEGSGEVDDLKSTIDEIAGDVVQPVNREDGNYDAQLYELQQQVNHLSRANELLAAGKRAEQYRQYLLKQQEVGTPVGDIEQMIGFMMTQTPDQVAQFKQMLEKTPKVALGKIDFGSKQNFDLNEQEVKQDYATNKETYNSLGVTAEDLKWAAFIRGTKVN